MSCLQIIGRAENYPIKEVVGLPAFFYTYTHTNRVNHEFINAVYVLRHAD